MAAPRSYKLLCPIARGLDRIGDRWTLLILRDLHAGPARFTDLQRGLTGIAANLLTDRLTKLVDDGLVEKQIGTHGAALYGLTETGAATREILFALALFGGRFAPEGPIVRPGNFRTIAVTLGAACQRVAPPEMSLEASIIVDGEDFVLSVQTGGVTMAYRKAETPDVVLLTSYDALLAVSEGEMSLEDFSALHCTTEVRAPGSDYALIALLSAAVAYLQRG